jgi:hypothetical protein
MGNVAYDRLTKPVDYVEYDRLTKLFVPTTRIALLGAWIKCDARRQGASCALRKPVQPGG